MIPEHPEICTGPPRLFPLQGAQQEAHVRYKQDLAEFLPIADGARLIQERAGITEDEAREDIVLVLREGAAYFQFWRLGRNGRSWCQPGHLPHGFLNNLTAKDIDWETSIACRRRVGEHFEVEIEVKRDDLSFLYPLLDDDGKREGSTIGAMEDDPATTEELEPGAPQAHDAQPSTPAKADQAQTATADELKDWFVNVYVPAHKDDSPNPTRNAALSAAKLEFPNYCDRTHLRGDLRKIWRSHAPGGWKRTGPRAKTE